MAVKAIKKKKRFRMVVGIDLSPSSIALAAKSYDPLADKIYGPVWDVRRWHQERAFSQWDKLRMLAHMDGYIFGLKNDLGAGGVVHEIGDIHIGIEEAPPAVMNAQRYREQCELIGAAVSSLLRYGYHHVYSVNPSSWQAMVAADLGMKKNREFTKFHVAEWVHSTYHRKWRPLIRKTDQGLVPQPKTSKAKPVQPDDRVDATAIMEWVERNKCK